jgi:GMP synthase (glutamine-hydrolysing)
MAEDRLHVGLVICGTPPPALTEYADGYLPMFRDLLEPHGLTLDAVEVRSGPVRPEPERFDGYLLTGSATSVYDDEPWIADAEDLVRAVVDAGIPLAGVCFGHQLIAQALGGRVEKAAAGWGAGVHTYTVATPLDGLGDDTGTMRLQAMHQDQVLDAPEGAVVWATSDHCPIAGYTVGDAVWTVQAHPEFTAPFATGVIGLREEVFGPDLHARAAATVDDPTDADAVAAAMAAFFRTAVAGRAARSATA